MSVLFPLDDPLEFVSRGTFNPLFKRKDETIEVHKELPSDAESRELSDYTVAWTEAGLFYYCRYCGGWIEGEPIETHTDTIGPLSGRVGETLDCRRCGEELTFYGKYS